MFDTAAIQSAVRESQLDGWLLYDFRGSNILARRILQFEDGPVGSRRWMYFIPAQGEPVKLVHRIETGAAGSPAGRKADLSEVAGIRSGGYQPDCRTIPGCDGIFSA